MSCSCLTLKKSFIYRSYLLRRFPELCWRFRWWWRLGGDLGINVKIKIGRRALSALPAVTSPTVFYDTDLTGFGLKASPTGALSYIVEHRPGAGGLCSSRSRPITACVRCDKRVNSKGYGRTCATSIWLGSPAKTLETSQCETDFRTIGRV